MCRRATGDSGRGGGAHWKNNRQGVDHMKRTILGLLAATAMSVSAFAADIKPAIIHDLGGKFDKSFNAAAFHGAEKCKTETGIAYRDFDIQHDPPPEQALRKLAEAGNSPIILTRLPLA